MSNFKHHLASLERDLSQLHLKAMQLADILNNEDSTDEDKAKAMQLITKVSAVISAYESATNKDRGKRFASGGIVTGNLPRREINQ